MEEGQFTPARYLQEKIDTQLILRQNHKVNPVVQKNIKNAS